MASSARRLYFVDAIRVLAIGIVFLVHVAEPFNPWDEWHITNADRSRLIGEISVFAAPWVMPIVMLLAGMGAWYSLAHRRNGAYLRDRVLRLLLPLVAGTLILVPPQVYLERRLRGQFAGSFIEFFPHFFDGIYPAGNLSWHYLWFLAHLFLYAVVALPLFRWLQRGGRESAPLRWAARLCGAPSGISRLAVPLILERNLLWGLFPERHMLTSDWSNDALLFVAYVYGFVLAGSSWLSDAINEQWRLALAVAVTGTAALMAGTWAGTLPAGIPPPYSVEYLLFWTVYAVCAWAWMVGVLGAARRWLDHESALIRYGRRMGYSLYIVHQPVVVAVAFAVVQWHASIAVKFMTVFVVSVAGTLASAEILSRISVARLLLGSADGRDTPVVARV